MAGSRRCIRRCMAACWRSATTPSTPAAMTAHGIEPIDLLVVNLYPFEATVAKGAGFDDCIENIDIGGPAMIRAAAKNHADVAVVVDAADYAARARRARPRTAARPRSRCASSSPPRPMRAPPPMTRRSRTGSPTQLDDAAPAYRAFGGKLAEALRYGENPHQSAAFYRTPEPRAGVATARQVQGKELSYNNINDTDAAYECVAEFDPKRTAACVIVKHANPCGVAEGASLARGLPQGAGLRSDLGLRRHRRAQPHARRRGGARDHRDLHRSDHRAGRDRGGDRDRRARRRTCGCCSPAACPIRARTA